MSKSKGVIRWKVVRVVGKGKRERMHSLLVPARAPHCCYYEIGVKAKAPFGGCLVFEAEHIARWFGTDWADEKRWAILRCECAAPVPLRDTAYSGYASEAICRKAWRGRCNPLAFPPGTEAYRYVTPLEVVE